MTLPAFVRRSVLNAICDDYENVDQTIQNDVARDAAECGLRVERSDIVDALAELVADGLAKAYLLSGTEPFTIEIDGMPPLDVVEQDFKTYFYVTEKGKRFHLSEDPSWPADDTQTELI